MWALCSEEAEPPQRSKNKMKEHQRNTCLAPRRFSRRLVASMLSGGRIVQAGWSLMMRLLIFPPLASICQPPATLPSLHGQLDQRPD